MTSAVPPDANARSLPAQGTLAGKYLTFFLAGEEYGIPILKVQEIIGMMPITRVPRTPPFTRGVINLRGKIIPVLDLRVRFSMPPTETTDQTCIVVVRAEGVEMGLIADRMSVVTHLAAEDIENVPDFGFDIDTRFLLAIGKSEGKVKLLLDIDRVLSREETRSLAELARTPDSTHRAERGSDQ